MNRAISHLGGRSGAFHEGQPPQPQTGVNPETLGIAQFPQHLRSFRGSLALTDNKFCHSSAVALRDSELAPSFGRQVSLGGTVLEANGLMGARRETIYISQNFIPSLRTQGGPPIQIDAEPDDNKSTNLLAVPSLSRGERAIVTTPPPGLVEYYVERGIIDSASQVVSFNGDIKLGRSLGLPYFDPLSLAQKSQTHFGSGYFVSAFTSPFVRQQAISLGLKPVQTSDSFDTNNKVDFGDKAETYGYSVADRVVLQRESDVSKAVERFRDTPVWVKFSHAFGGDLLVKCDSPVTEDSILEAISRMKASVVRATEQNNYGGCSIGQIWPDDQLLPNFYGIVVEQDVRYIGGARSPGRVIATGSNLMVIDREFGASVAGYFEQIIGPAGDFWGSRSFDPGTKFGQSVKDDLDRQFAAIGRYAAEEFSLFGLVGVDFMVVEAQDGRVFPVMIELNGRPPISACSHIVGTQKLQAPAWVSRYIWAPEPVVSAEDFERLMTIDGQSFAHSRVADGAVIPMYLSSVCHSTKDGVQAILPKRWLQVLVAGESEDHCTQIFDLLAEKKGISYTRPNTW